MGVNGALLFFNSAIVSQAHGSGAAAGYPLNI
jgi:hypothetical protein